jgi:hypothetical protein
MFRHFRWGWQRRRDPRGSARRFRPQLEALEDRALLTGGATLTLSGTFNMTFQSGVVGDDLRTILGHDNGWTITLRNVNYFPYYDDVSEMWETTVSAESFQFAFTGVDAALLNDVAGPHFTQGHVSSGGIQGGFFQVSTGLFPHWLFWIGPPDLSTGVNFDVSGEDSFPLDSAGFPVIESRSLRISQTVLTDNRGSGGLLASFGDNLSIVRDDCPAPEIQVLDGATDIPDDTGAVSFGSTSVGAPVSKTFTVRNTGTADLTLSPVISVPAGFTVTAGFGAATLAPGTSTTFTVRLDATTADVFSGPLSFGNNDADENPFNFTLSGTVTAPTMNRPPVLDPIADRTIPASQLVVSVPLSATDPEATR